MVWLHCAQLIVNQKEILRSGSINLNWRIDLDQEDDANLKLLWMETMSLYIGKEFPGKLPVLTSC